MNFTSKRCYITRFKEEDIDSFIEYRNNLEWMKYQGFKGLSKVEYKSALIGHQLIEHGVQLAIFCKQSGILIGDIYLQRNNDECWIGYTISPLKARQGYMYEVLLTVILELKKYEIKQVNAGVNMANMASINLLKKLNFTYSHIEEGEHIYKLII